MRRAPSLRDGSTGPRGRRARPPPLRMFQPGELRAPERTRRAVPCHPPRPSRRSVVLVAHVVGDVVALRHVPAVRGAHLLVAPDLVFAQAHRVKGLHAFYCGRNSDQTRHKPIEGNTQLYGIRRRNAWATAEDLEAAAKRSTEEGDKPDSGVRWIRSYVLQEDDGRRHHCTTRPRARRHRGRSGVGFTPTRSTKPRPVLVMPTRSRPRPASRLATRQLVISSRYRSRSKRRAATPSRRNAVALLDTSCCESPSVRLASASSSFPTRHRSRAPDAVELRGPGGSEIGTATRSRSTRRAPR